ncbi:hypothetical protein FQN60_014777 [Etheostoma spectabile]|uniref:Uncharacterized protein n=1 Tax=Etheostoma spectabile TaxID=54343 RepID=A0A5J5CRP0_9PERO|nr:hypothetical protein FQN60_014777 [Etheostoma spectabile]
MGTNWLRELNIMAPFALSGDTSGTSSLAFIFCLGGPQCICPMVSGQGPLREL